MKTLVKLVMLLVVLVMSLPVQGDILIYNKTVKFEGVDVGGGTGDDDFYTETDRGYLILDVTIEGGVITSVNNAVQVIYGRERGEKWTDYWIHNLNIVRFQEGRHVAYALMEYDSDEGYFYSLMVAGRARNRNIGNADPNEVPQKLDGYAMEHEDGDFSERGTYKLKLNNNLTKAANRDSKTFEEAYVMVQELLGAKGYDLDDLPV